MTSRVQYTQCWRELVLPRRDSFAILGRGPRAFLIGKISDVNPEFGKISKHSKFTIFSKLT